ncbi:protein prenyltransferase alpha subunit repeat domain containing protein [Babesia divergens]|uniref:Geranylgeranyl transferase type-2 subunit alpha n=1 Tax=Babesia divergens TaxID=32595 RepID=A0AAD9G7F2_BABDI|nr:protein prenyltransferase alpha subunit repeat domain containing protein [Babesia divergens]
MHGIRREDFYKTPVEERAFAEKLKKGFRLLDSFVASVKQSELTVDSEGGLLEDPTEAERMFSLSGDITDFMPEFYPSWNYRKNYMLQKAIDPERILLLLKDELTFSASVLKKAPKCYAVWHHRLWVLTVLLNVRCDDLVDILKNEISLCMLFFKFDGRNFHGWGYLNFIKHYLYQVESSSNAVPTVAVDKLCYSEFKKLIETNFSNYSAWFNQGNLSETCGSITEDLESLTPAIYTDPNDQCLWHYFDWLLYHRNALRYFLVRCHYFEESQSFVVYFNTCVHLSRSDSFITITTYEAQVEKVEGRWEGFNCGLSSEKLEGLSVPQYVWRFVARQAIQISAIEHVSLCLMIETDDDIVRSYYSHMTQMAKCIISTDISETKDVNPCLLSLRYELRILSNGDMPLNMDSMSIMRSNMSNVSGWDDMSAVLGRPIRLPGSSCIVSLGRETTTEIFEKQLEMISELLGICTDSKYLYLARHKILRFIGEPSDAEECYKHVKRIDPLRATMYEDMLLKEKVQDALEGMDNKGLKSACLSGMGIKHLSYSTLCPHVMFETLDLSSNALSDSSSLDFGVMLKLRHLSLANNRFTSLRRILGALSNLHNLKSLDVSRNPLITEEDELFKAIPPSLITIDITGTPLAASFIKEGDASSLSTYEGLLHTHCGVFSMRIGDASGISKSRPESADVTGCETKVFLERSDT